MEVLPPELLLMVLSRVPPSQVLPLRQVCRRWKEAVGARRSLDLMDCDVS